VKDGDGRLVFVVSGNFGFCGCDVQDFCSSKTFHKV
jgi:hypothetical protein